MAWFSKAPQEATGKGKVFFHIGQILGKTENLNGVEWVQWDIPRGYSRERFKSYTSHAPGGKRASWLS